MSEGSDDIAPVPRALLNAVLDELTSCFDRNHLTTFSSFTRHNGATRHWLLASDYNWRHSSRHKQIFRAMDRYWRALRELGGCKAFVSPVSSKLLSIGALLACYDHKNGDVPNDNRLRVGIPYVETAVFGDPAQDPSARAELYSMWIRGDWEV